MKKIAGWILIALITLCCVAALADVEINETNFPDENFRIYVSEKCDFDWFVIFRHDCSLLLVS